LLVTPVMLILLNYTREIIAMTYGQDNLYIRLGKTIASHFSIPIGKG